MKDSTTDETIKNAVCQTYGKLARRFVEESRSTTNATTRTGCCGPAETAVESPCPSARLYPTEDLTNLPSSVTGASAGCGNPVAIAELQPGEVVLDLGAGGGIDCFLAAQKVGPEGRVIGLDMTPDMIKLAQRNAKKIGATNVEFRFGEMEDIPLPDESVDVIISNCVINLSPDKDAVFSEAYRVLRPGGRLMVSDMVVDGELPASVRDRLDAWAGCVAGALVESDYLSKIRAAGFEHVQVISRDTVPDDHVVDEETAQIVSMAPDGPIEGKAAQAFLAEAGLSLNDLARAVASIQVKAYKPTNASHQEEHGERPGTETVCQGCQAAEQQIKIPMSAGCVLSPDSQEATLLQSVQIPFDLVGNKVYLPVRINGLEPSNFVLDTGAPAWFIDLEHARALGLPLDDSVDLVFMGAGSVEKSSASRLSGLSLDLPGLQLTGQNAITLPMPGCNLGYPAIQGIVGGSFIGSLVVEFDFIDCVMTLHQPSTYEYRGSGTIVPIERMGGIPFIQATLTPLGREPIEAPFAVDMGFGGVVSLNTPFVNTHNLTDAFPQLLHSILGFGVGGPVYGKIGRVEALQIGSYRIESPICALSDTTQGAHAQSGFAGIIGMELLRRFHLILDYSRQRIILEKNAHLDDPYEHDMSGVVLTSVGEHFRVEAVVEGSPAAEVGLQVGDLITHVDGQEAASVELVGLRQAFLQAGNRYPLQITRGNEQHQVTLTMRRLI